MGLNSPVWDDSRRQQIVSNCLTRIAKRFAQKEVTLMEQEQHTGRIYKLRAGPGFMRFHQASARGERPARQTGALINAIDDRKVSPSIHDVFIDGQRANYGSILQNSAGLDRPTFKQGDLDEFSDNEMQQEVKRALAQLTGGENTVG